MPKAGRKRPGSRYARRSGGQSGFSIVEVLAATLVVGIAVTGIALMFGKGSAWMAATGDDRVAAGLAQQRIEQIRAKGWGSATESGTIGTVLVDPPISAGGPPCLPSTPESAVCNNRLFTRTVCIQYVDPASAAGLATPPFASTSCPAGTPSQTIRMTVSVVLSAHAQTEPYPVILQAWMTRAGP